MADTDEAAIHLPSQDSAPQIETDLSDETQDFRFLNQIAFATPDSSQSTLPRRGEKDFEPNPTLHQADVLDASRQAMHTALSWPRLHHSKHRVVGFYAPDGPVPPAGVETPKDHAQQQQQQQGKEDTENNQGHKPVKAGMGVPADSCAYVPNPKGQYFKSIGRADRWNRVWLLPEEALYLLERGSLDIRWPVDEEERDETEDDEGIPMSLQAAYACFMGRAGLTMERFSVYTGLRRLGYTVIRAPGWDDTYDGSGEKDIDSSGSALSTLEQKQEGAFGRFLQWLYAFGHSNSTGLTTTGPVMGLGIHRRYEDIYSKLSIIPYHDPTVSKPPAQTAKTPPSAPSAPFRVIFHIYKPSTAIKKSAPPPPDFRIAVISTTTQPTTPTLAQLSALLESTPLDPPRGEKMDRMLYMRLRHGYRNVILAVVDHGVVSYLRVGDSAFGREKVYMQKGMQRGKKGGGGPRPKK